MPLTDNRQYRYPSSRSTPDLAAHLAALAEDVDLDATRLEVSFQTAVQDMEETVQDLEDVVPSLMGSPTLTFAIVDKDGRRSWVEIDSAGNPTERTLDLLASLLGTPTPLLNDSLTFAVVDKDGRRSWLEADAAGKPTPRTIGILRAALEVSAPVIDAEALVDPARSLAVRDPAGTVRPLTSSPFSVFFGGDSLLDGWPRPQFNVDQSNSLPGRFATLVPGVQVINGGKTGQSADEIAIRQGGLVLLLAVSGGQIPASGSVAVSTAQSIGWRLDRGTDGFTGSLAGVPGKLTRSGSAITFTRTAAGTAVPVPGVLPWESSWRDHAGAVQVLLAGRNDIGYTSAAGPVVDRVVTATQAMVESLTPMYPRALVLGTITSTGETRGSAGWDQVTQINAKLKALYPDLFWDFRSWLVNEAIHVLGITPTADDKSRMASDTLPPSIMTDGVHYSPATADAAARRIHVELKNRGWL